MRIKSAYPFAYPIFLVGVLTGLTLAITAAWADFEGLSYFATGASFAPFNGLKCPVLIARAEAGIVSATFVNRTQVEIAPYYKVEISGLTGLRQLKGQVEIPSQTRRDVSWTVDARDIDLRNFVLVRLITLPVAGQPARDSTCGILVIDLVGINGGQALGLTLGISLLCMAVGLLLSRSDYPTKPGRDPEIRASLELRRASQALGIATVLAILAALAGWWLAAVVFCVLALLLLVIRLRYSF